MKNQKNSQVGKGSAKATNVRKSSSKKVTSPKTKPSNAMKKSSSKKVTSTKTRPSNAI